MHFRNSNRGSGSTFAPKAAFRPSFRGGRRPSHQGGRPMANRSRGRFQGIPIDVSRYVNKNAKIEASAPYVPTNKFCDFGVEAILMANITAKGYSLPTPIQDKTIPLIMKGADVVGTANTGTGKTAAFLIPLINKILLNRKEQVLVVVPTRELALQIEEELKSFSKGLFMHSVCCVGGASIGPQLRGLRFHNSFVIGTPGRLKDLIERKALNLSTFKTVVLDEADRMLDMGFIHDMRYMMALMPKERHTLFFSATISHEIERLISDFLKNPVRISVKTQDTAKNIEQDIIRCKDSGTKIDILHELLNKDGCDRVLIFGRTKHGVERLSNTLTARGFKSASIHGNKSQSQRERALKDFKESRAKILCATDVAARGLDIADVTHVINFDLPATHEDYIHRIGRTGRGDKKGKALTFVD